jgi:hypothetical protein
MNPTKSNHIEQEYSVRFVIRPQYSEFYPLRDAWFVEMAAHRGVSRSSEYLDGRLRDVVRTEFRSAKLLAKPHEWGAEYIVSFTLGVASGIVANVIYDLLKEQVPHYAEMLKKLSSRGCRDIRIDIELDRLNETVKIDVIEPGRGPVSVSLSRITKAIDEIDPQKGARRRPRTSTKRKKK